MEALAAVEKEVDKALESFGTFYDDINDDIEHTIQLTIDHINELMKTDNESIFKNTSIVSTQLVRDNIKELIKKYSDKHKDLHGTISKIGKVIDKNFISEFGNLPQIDIIETVEKKNLLNQIICEHFLRRGRTDVADALVQDASIDSNDFKKQSFIEMDFILEKIRAKDLQPALDWCNRNREKLKEINSSLEFNLHRLNFIKLIEQGAKFQHEALKYSRNFTPFALTCKKEIQRLMASLLYLNSGLELSPYSTLLNADAWDDIEEEFIKNVCKLMGLSVECPLAVCINAGCKALPALINIVQVMQQTQVGHILSKDELPIEIDVGSGYRYHSVFACPILRQQSTDANPPMKLICGHVISKDALNKLNGGGKLKCPYCPMEQTPAEAKQIYF